jgi:hypothetical protein
MARKPTARKPGTEPVNSARDWHGPARVETGPGPARHEACAVLGSGFGPLGRPGHDTTESGFEIGPSTREQKPAASQHISQPPAPNPYRPKRKTLASIHFHSRGGFPALLSSSPLQSPLANWQRTGPPSSVAPRSKPPPHRRGGAPPTTARLVLHRPPLVWRSTARLVLRAPPLVFGLLEFWCSFSG